MRWKVMISAPYMQPVLQRFRPVFDENGIDLVIPPVHERLGEEELLTYIADLDGVICGDDRFTARVLERAKRMKVISKWGTGIDSIDRDAAARLGIAVCNTPNAFTHPVADSTLGYILNFARRIDQSTRELKSGSWEKIHCVALRECTLGVIGVGNIGKAVIRRAVAFGMKILCHDILDIEKSFLEQTGADATSREELLRLSDFVTLHCDLNPTSFHLMNRKTFALMKRSAFIINTSRGPVVEEKALIDALQKGALAGAALDVYEEEPLPENSPLRRMDNCLLAPHNANSSPEAWEHVHQNTIKNLLDVLKNGKK